MEPTLIADLIRSYTTETDVQSSVEKNIMSIAGIEHLENIWSNIYSYFLDERASHGLGSVFLKCLEQLIFKKSGRIVDLSGAVIEREVSTIKGNRIDLLIQTSGKSVIIENKVFHHLNNDLDDYWLSVGGDDVSKTGIVLTLSHIMTNNPHFINITHLEWVTEVEQEIITRHIVLDSATSILLNDFINNIKQVSPAMNENDVSFYLTNRLAINELHQVASKYRNWLQLLFTKQEFIRGLGDFTLVHNDWKGAKDRFAMYRFAATDELVITVFYESLWKSKPGKAELWLFLQPLGAWLDKAIEKENDVRSIAYEEGVPSMARNKDFWHCASVRIPVSEEQLQSEEALRRCVSENIANPESGLMVAARRISELLSQSHRPSYLWKDALDMLKRLLPEDDDANRVFWCTTIEFKSYDSVNHIVTLEVIDNIFRDEIERNFGKAFIQAIRYAYGNDARYAIHCRQYMF